MEHLTEESNCAICLITITRESNKLDKILVNTAGVKGGNGERIVSIYEALAVIFEIPPLPQAIRPDCDKSKFKVKRNDGDYFVCCPCSKNLKELYTKFQELIQVCKEESIVGNILKELRRDRDKVVVKREPVELDGEEEEELDNGDDESQSVCQGPSVFTVKSVVKVEPEEEEDDPDRGEGPCSPSCNNENIPPPPVSKPKPIPVQLACGPGVLTPYKCNACFKEFLYENTLICHRRIMHNETVKMLPPNLLPRMNVSQLGKRQDSRAISGGVSSICPICHGTVLRSEIRRHLFNHTRNFPNKSAWLCSICGKDFLSLNALKTHNSSVHLAGIPCKSCGIRVPTVKLLVHLRQCMTGRNRGSFECQLCRKTFQTSTSLADHRASAHGSVWKCKLCGIKFTNWSTMTLHMASHKQKKLHKCKICEKSFDRLDMVRLHVKRFHRSGPPSVAPPPSLQPSSPDLSEHFEETPESRKTASVTSNANDDQLNSPSLECSLENCEKIFNDKTSFFYHLKYNHGLGVSSIMTKFPHLFPRKASSPNSGQARNPPKVGAPQERDFTCETCGKAFTQAAGLRGHIKLVHEKIKNFLCKYCGKAFARRSYFNIHERLHTSAEEPYKCHLCGKGFRLPGGLRTHLQSTIHNTARDYVCDICGKGFSRRDNLRLHVNSVHLKIRKEKSSSSSTWERFSSGGRHRLYMGDQEESAEPTPGTSQAGKESHRIQTSYDYRNREPHLSSMPVPLVLHSNESLQQYQQTSFE